VFGSTIGLSLSRHGQNYQATRFRAAKTTESGQTLDGCETASWGEAKALARPRAAADRRPEKQRHGPATPAKKIRESVSVSRKDTIAFPVFSFSPKSPSQNDPKGRRQVLYLHGGGFVHDFGPVHFKFLATLVQRTNMTVIAPGYPVAPDQTWRNSASET
jgi:acetyl esterase/lipase